MRALLITALIALSGCNVIQVHVDKAEVDLYADFGPEGPVYRFNPIELQYELTHPDSKLRYNIFEREWVFVK